MYELGSGRELTVPCPSAEDMKSIRNAQVAEVVEFILHRDKIPDIAEVNALQVCQSSY